MLKLHPVMVCICVDIVKGFTYLLFTDNYYFYLEVCDTVHDHGHENIIIVPNVYVFIVNVVIVAMYEMEYETLKPTNDQYKSFGRSAPAMLKKQMNPYKVNHRKAYNYESYGQTYPMYSQSSY